MVKVLVVGVGSMGWNHARVCSDMGVLSAVCDRDKVASDKVAKTFGVSGYTDLETAMKEISPDAAIIATPTVTHYEIATKVLERGCNLLIEKPFVHDQDHGAELIRLSSELGLTMSVGHIERYNPVVTRAKQHLDNGTWGELITISSRRVSPFSGRIQDVGAILDVGIHDIDNLIFLMGSKPISVYATGGSFNNIDHEDYANLIMKFENGRSGIIEVNWISPMKVRTLSLTCNDRFVELDFINQNLIISKSAVKDHNSKILYPAPIEFESTKIGLTKREPLRIEIEDFLDSITNKRVPLVSAPEALLSLEVALGAVQSLKTGEVVSIGS